MYSPMGAPCKLTAARASLCVWDAEEDDISILIQGHALS